MTVICVILPQTTASTLNEEISSSSAVVQASIVCNMCLRWPSQVCTVPGERCNDRRESNRWFWLLRNEFHGLAKARQRSRAFSKSLRNARLRKRYPTAGNSYRRDPPRNRFSRSGSIKSAGYRYEQRPLCLGTRPFYSIEKIIFPPYETSRADQMNFRRISHVAHEDRNKSKVTWRDTDTVADVKHSSFDTTNEAYCRGRRVSLSRQESDDLVEPHKNTCLVHLYHAMYCIVHQLFHHVCCPLAFTPLPV